MTKVPLPANKYMRHILEGNFGNEKKFVDG